MNKLWICLLAAACGGNSAPVTPGVVPAIASFTATPATVAAGGTATLSWTVTGATSLSIDQGVGAVTGALKDFVPAGTTVSTAYTLTATNAAGSTTAQAIVKVKPAITAFVASPASIAPGASSTLSWTVDGPGPVTLSISAGVGAVTGTSHTVTPGTTTLYTLTATNDAGSSTANATVALAGPQLWVSAYYAGYFWDEFNGGDANAALAEVDFTQLTHLIFARYAPGAGSLGGTAGTLREGAGTAHTQVETPLINAAHAAGKKALMMIGGAGDGAGWTASSDSTHLAAFVTAILDKAVARNYDGVDIDWEDGLDNATSTSRLVALMNALRSGAANRARYQPPNAPFTLTYPAPWVNINTDLPLSSEAPWLKQVCDAADQCNVMSYDMEGDYSGWKTWLWAALKDASGTTPSSIESTIQAYVDLGIPRTKMGMGLGLYASVYTAGVTGPRQAITTEYQEGDASFPSWTYGDLDAKGMLASSAYVFDTAAQTGYYSYATPKTYAGKTNLTMLITEDLQSIAAKGAWAKAGGCGGTIVWMLNYGYEKSNPTTKNPPMAAIKAAFLP